MRFSRHYVAPAALMLTAAAVGLAGCSSLFHQPPPTVSIPVPVPCVRPDDKPKRPALVTQAELDGYTDYQYVLGLERHRVQSEPYIAELEAVVEGCSRLASP
jgi:hypothetical protein